LTGDPGRWLAAMSTGPPTSTCFDWVIRELGGTAPGALPAPLSLVALRDAFREAGLMAEVEPGESLEDLAQQIEIGRLVLAVMNAGTAWDAPDAAGCGEPDHPVLVSAVARAPATGDLIGVFARDPSYDGVRFVTAEHLVRAWLLPGGWMVWIGSG
jgi:hypothetical protein